MAHAFSIGSIEQKNLIASDSAYLVAIEVGVREIGNPNIIENLYLVSNNENRVLGGVEYTSFPFSIDFKYEAGGQGSVKVRAKDVTRDLQARMQKYNGGVGFNVRLKIFHQDNTDQAPEFEELFQVISSSSQDYVVSWTLGAENLVDRQFPARRQFRDRCPWAYKSAECGYTGTMESCSYSLSGENGCRSHNNSINFGGFPGLRSA